MHQPKQDTSSHVSLTLLTGPPGSGKSETILRKIRRLLTGRRSDFLLLTPTATMAEHLSHRLAREGFVFSPAVIQTLAEFVQDQAPGLTPCSHAAERLILDEALDAAPPQAFRDVSAFPGFRESAARLIHEFQLAGCSPGDLEALYSRAGLDSPSDQAFLAIYRSVDERLKQQGLATRAALLRAAAASIQAGGAGGIREVYLDGFESFSDLELGLIATLSAGRQITVTMPLNEASRSTRERLLDLGFKEERLARRRPLAAHSLFVASTDTQEAEEIARRILEFHAAGKPFRQIGVIVRSEAPFVPALRSAFIRFGIPAHFYFADRLAGHPVAWFLSGLVDALLHGWEHRALLAALRAAAGHDPGFDHLDFAVREGLENRGLEALGKLRLGERWEGLMDAIRPLEAWRDAPARPEVWAQRLANLTSLFVPRGLEGPWTPEAIETRRSQAWALRNFETAMAETAGALAGAGPMPLEEFWRRASAAVRLAELRIPDHRREAVHVMDAVEARQWELPVVFVCHLLKEQFPKPHAEHPLLPDEARRRLNLLGLRLRTGEELRRQERDLFDVALSRATEHLILSYPQYNYKGEENLPSPFLTGCDAPKTPVFACRPEGARAKPRASRPALQAPEVIELAAARHTQFTPTGLELFLVCPYRFFLERTLGLAEPPAEPLDRLTPQLVGQIAHAAIRDWHAQGGDICAIGERLLDEEIARRRIPAGYRAAKERYTLRWVLNRYAADAGLMPGWRAAVEKEFALPLDGGVVIAGRIDRCDIGPSGEALVIDFKYGGDSRMQEILNADEAGAQLQVALYLLALAERHTPVGMFYWCLRGRKRVLDGWHANLPGWPGTAMTAGDLREKMEAARSQAFQAASSIRAGVIRPQPEESACEKCTCFDVCRERTTAVRRQAAGGEP